MDSCCGLVMTHQHGIADTRLGGFCKLSGAGPPCFQPFHIKIGSSSNFPVVLLELELWRQICWPRQTMYRVTIQNWSRLWVSNFVARQKSGLNTRERAGLVGLLSRRVSAESRACARRFCSFVSLSEIRDYSQSRIVPHIQLLRGLENQADRQTF